MNYTGKGYWTNLVGGNGRELERACKALYEDLGYKVETTDATGDGNRDLVIRKKGKVGYVECKAYAKPVGVKEIRAFIGVCSIDNIEQRIFIGLSGFTDDAERTAKKGRVELLNAGDLSCLANTVDTASARKARKDHAVKGIIEREKRRVKDENNYQAYLNRKYRTHCLNSFILSLTPLYIKFRKGYDTKGQLQQFKQFHQEELGKALISGKMHPNSVVNVNRETYPYDANTVSEKDWERYLQHLKDEKERPAREAQEAKDKQERELQEQEQRRIAQERADRWNVLQEERFLEHCEVEQKEKSYDDMDKQEKREYWLKQRDLRRDSASLGLGKVVSDAMSVFLKACS
jgi:hypothetical protein